jgi:hypothetical protein
MKKFNKLFKVGTKVKINGKWYSTRSINDQRIHIKVNGLAGEMQRGHIEQFSNTDKELWRWDDSLFNFNEEISATKHLTTQQYISTNGRVKVTIERFETGKELYSRIFDNHDLFVKWWGDRSMNDHHDFLDFISILDYE